MAKMTKAQAQRRLQEAIKKCQAVYMANLSGTARERGIVSTADMAAIEKILYKCMNRLK